MRITILCFFLSSLFIYGQVETISTDRPGQTKSASTVGKNSFQIEAGLYHTNYNFSVIPTLVKYGVSKNVEFRLSANDGAQKSRNSFYSVGSKIKLFDQNNFFSGISIIAALDFYDEIKPYVIIAGSNDLKNNITIGYNAGVTKASDQFSVITSIKASTEFYKGTYVFIELYGGLYPEELFFDTGFTYLLKNYLQLDCSMGVSIYSDHSGWFIGAGASYYLPNLF